MGTGFEMTVQGVGLPGRRRAPASDACCRDISGHGVWGYIADYGQIHGPV